jgi:hypothetical protein
MRENVAGIHAFCMTILPKVIVPVLSEQTSVTAESVSMASMRLTSALLAASVLEAVANDKATTAGKLAGRSETAAATA